MTVLDKVNNTKKLQEVVEEPRSGMEQQDVQRVESAGIRPAEMEKVVMGVFCVSRQTSFVKKKMTMKKNSHSK